MAEYGKGRAELSEGKAMRFRAWHGEEARGKGNAVLRPAKAKLYIDWHGKG